MRTVAALALLSLSALATPASAQIDACVFRHADVSETVGPDSNRMTPAPRPEDRSGRGGPVGGEDG